MQSADQWLRTTDNENASLAPTEDETSSALSTVFFRYRFRNTLAKGISTLIRNIRPQRSFRNPVRAVKAPLTEEEQRYRRLGTRSMPHVDLPHQRSSLVAPLDKGKQPMRQQTSSSVDVRTSQHTKSLDWASTYSGGFNPNIGGSGSKPRRGSAPGHALTSLETLGVPERSSRLSSPQRSPMCPSPSPPYATDSLQEQDRPRSRLSLLMRWMINKPASSSPQSPSTQTSGAASPIAGSSALRLQPARDLTSRRSEDAINRLTSRLGGSESGSLTQAMRAASWGEVGIGRYSRPSEDMASLYSDHGEEGPDEDTYLVGFGGVAQSPVSTVPSAVLSTVSSMGSLSAAVPMLATQMLLQRAEPSGEPPSAAVSATQDTITPQRQTQFRSHATSPLSHAASREDMEREQSEDAPTFEESDDSDSSGDQTPSETDYGDQPANASTMYEDEDEDSEDEGGQPLEVRTRRPSWVAHSNSRPSSPRRQDAPRGGRT